MAVNIEHCRNVPNVETDSLSFDSIPEFEQTRMCVKLPSFKTGGHTRNCGSGTTPNLWISGNVSVEVLSVPLDLNPFDEDTTELLVDMGIWIGLEYTPGNINRLWMGSEEAGVCVKDPDPRDPITQEAIVTVATDLLNQLENYYEEDHYDLIFTYGSVVLVGLLVYLAWAMIPQAASGGWTIAGGALF